jgi:Holliday junction resolvase RusA-like endonuclease
LSGDVETVTMKFTIFGQPFSKANSRRIVMFGNRPASIKSDKAREYADQALGQFIHQMDDKTPFSGPVVVEMTIYYPDKRQDLDPSLVLDVMQEYKHKGSVIWQGVYKNDRQVQAMHLYRKVDKTNPRCEIEVHTL